MRIAIAQINPTLGDFKANKEKIIEFTKKAKQRKCDIVVFPESTLFGYHPFDLLEREKIVSAQEKVFRSLIKSLPANIGVIFGLITKNKSKKGRPYFNSAVFIAKNKPPRFFHKQLLPTGDVFDEARFIETGDLSNNYFSWKGKNFFLTICEDIWAWPAPNGTSSYKENPLSKIKRKKVDLVINMSASPFHLGKIKSREYVTTKTAAWFKAPVLYANMVGAQDEIIFDGASFVINPKGKVLLKCQSFEEDLNVFDLKTQAAWSNAHVLTQSEQLRKALTLGIRDFCQKVGIEKVHFGLSGGIDSAVVACLAVDALGPGRVKCFALPGPFSSSESLDLAQKLAKNLNIDLNSININPIYEKIIGVLNSSLDLKNFSLVHENIQARLRGLILMAQANKDNSLLLTTGNKSEYASGYATLYGDMCGGLAPLGDLTKAQVYQLARLYNAESEIIPERIISRPPTAELRPNQKDQDSLPPYDELDQAVVNLVERSKAARTRADKWLLPILMKTEFKRWQAAPILKVSAHSFGRGRRLPVAHRAKEI